MKTAFMIATLAGLIAAPGVAHPFAALAIDSNQGTRYSWSGNFDDKAGAIQRALSGCGAGCRVVVLWDTGCAAFNTDMAAGNSHIYGIGTGQNANQAKSNARKACLDKGGINCTTRVWACDRLASSPVSGGNQ